MKADSISPQFTAADLKPWELEWVKQRSNQNKIFNQAPDLFSFILEKGSELTPRGLFRSGDNKKIDAIAGFKFVESDLDLAIIAWVVEEGLELHRWSKLALDRLTAEARSRGAKRLLTKCYLSEDKLIQFFNQHHFKELGSSCVMSLALSDAEPESLEIENSSELHIFSLAHFPRIELANRLIEVWNRTQIDQPQDWPFTPFSARQFEQEILSSADVDLSHSFALVTACNEIIGLNLNSPNPDKKRIWTHFTGILPEFRGRNLGLLLKCHLIQHAKKQGFLELAAENDMRNNSMMRINRILGFQMADEWVTFEKWLEPTPL